MAGAVGVDMGRNIWQSDNPVPMIRAVRSIVHGSQSVDEAFEMYKSLSNENSKKKSTPKPQITNTTPRKPKNFPPRKPKNFPPRKPKNFPPRKPQK